MGAVLKVAVDVPVRELFDYRAPQDNPPPPGTRVLVPFGRRRRVGLVLEHAARSTLAADRLKYILGPLDDAPLLPPALLELIRRAAAYYHHPIGEVAFTALPALLRGPRSAAPAPTHLSLTPAGHACAPAELTRAPRRRALLERLQGAGGALALTDCAADDAGRRAARALVAAGLAELTGLDRPPQPAPPSPATSRPQLNPAQAGAVAAVGEAFGSYGAFLLDGVTGSGKTEVYLRLIEAAAARGRQSLLLVPEISLTPQTVARVEARLPGRVVALHSGLTDRARLDAWQAAGQGRAEVVLGTRSAVFVPLARPGLIVVDEEHDPSYKQQEGFRYHGRDLAVLRARIEGTPVLLGSATPALESLAQAKRGRYRPLELPQRAAGTAPRLELIDLRRSAMRGPLSPPLERALDETLAAGGQALLFLNRRGFAPVLLCHACGHVPACARCDARLTLHRTRGRLVCHHCGHERPVPVACPACAAPEPRALGAGTERIETLLAQRFPQAAVLRLDRDSTARVGALARGLDAARSGAAQLLVGTQMLAKGHHFPQVALAAVLDADQGLYAADFRARERLAQLIAQVAGRAGRAERPGRVLVQTHHPDHPLLGALIAGDYGAVAAMLAAEREEAGLPPFAHLALLRAQAGTPQPPLAFLRAAGELFDAAQVGVMGPVPAPMPRRAGQHRAQLAVSTVRRSALHRALAAALPRIQALPLARRVRWSLDVDPMDLA